MTEYLSNLMLLLNDYYLQAHPRRRHRVSWNPPPPESAQRAGGEAARGAEAGVEGAAGDDMERFARIAVYIHASTY